MRVVGGDARYYEDTIGYGNDLRAYESTKEGGTEWGGAMLARRWRGGVVAGVRVARITNVKTGS